MHSLCWPDNRGTCKSGLQPCTRLGRLGCCQSAESSNCCLCRLTQTPRSLSVLLSLAVQTLQFLTIQQCQQAQSGEVAVRRSHKDLVKEAAPHYKKARKFYDGLAAQLVQQGHALDVFACSLDQVRRSGPFLVHPSQLSGTCAWHCVNPSLSKQKSVCLAALLPSQLY